MLRRRDLGAGHWAPFSHWRAIAGATAELIDHIEGAPAARALRRAQVGRSREPFSDTLVSVTGAGSGIGRATALAFAAHGAELVVSDIDEASAKSTADEIAASGGVAHAYGLDVSDAEAVERFVEQVCGTHGVPDVVVNNAGIGHGGKFLDTPADQYDRVLDVNFGGVVNCCRSFARRLIEREQRPHRQRGLDGCLYTVGSDQRILHQQGRGVHVLRLSACRIEVGGVGLTTICPGVIDTNIIDTTRFDLPADKQDKGEQMRAQAKGLRRATLRPGKGGQSHRRGRPQGQGRPAGYSRSLCGIRDCAADAVGAAPGGALRLAVALLRMGGEVFAYRNG